MTNSTSTTSLDYTARRISQILENIAESRAFIRILTTENSTLDASQRACLNLAGRQLCEMEVEYAELAGTPVQHHTAILALPS